MIAGPQYAPGAYRGTALEAILPVNISQAAEDDGATLTQGFRPVLTPVGAASSIFRFFADRAINDVYLKEDLQPIFWYARGLTTKIGVGETYAEHPSDLGPDGRKAPILVLGRFGAGRTLFSAIDDSWRWRYYTGEQIFDTYWIQQIRYLARSKKLGQRRATLTSVRPAYDLGQQIMLNLRVLDPKLQVQLSDQLPVEVLGGDGQLLRREMLIRQDGQPGLYTASFTADRAGKFQARLSNMATGVDVLAVPYEVAAPKVELSQPQVDRALLARLASETLGQVVPAEQAQGLPAMIASAKRVIPVETARPLWDAPLALFLFALLLTAEWVGRKVFGML